ncbi:thioesterase family protein [Sulfitobacter sp. F26169L]|uniref:acyl-CoA thioesterase n=1 Tax=Sulfitobacter sp. F26169L TaxID=2996015 RepID=UPI002260A9A4|nr:thioesterase family protein [Sulfitobacter sp. F26169L]MCX7567973.1 thioesterase family protein [Sulfitobacter sp. F26169L]
MNRDAYPLTRQMQTRWNDNDTFGHMNNAVHYQFFDTIVNCTLDDLGYAQGADHPTRFLVVETGCKYFAEMAYPDSITLGLGIAHLGNSSVRYALGMFRNDDMTPSAEGHFIHVNVDRITKRPVAIRDDLKRELDALRWQSGRMPDT